MLNIPSFLSSWWLLSWQKQLTHSLRCSRSNLMVQFTPNLMVQSSCNSGYSASYAQTWFLGNSTLSFSSVIVGEWGKSLILHLRKRKREMSLKQDTTTKGCTFITKCSPCLNVLNAYFNFSSAAEQSKSWIRRFKLRKKKANFPSSGQVLLKYDQKCTQMYIRVQGHFLVN